VNNEAYTDPTKRHDFVLLVDIRNGNMNGDPDSENLPRIDAETDHGIATDVCIKRKVRDFVALSGERIYIENSQRTLNQKHEDAYEAAGKTPTPKKEPPREVQNAVREQMCRTFWDVRNFGAVMTTDINAGQVREPIQFSYAETVSPVEPVMDTITRQAVTTEEDWNAGKRQTMGDRKLIRYGLFRWHGAYSPALAQQTGTTEEDLRLFWTTLARMWDHDRSAARFLTALRGLYIFTHESTWGNAPAHSLFERIKIREHEGVEAPRGFEDYSVEVDDSDLPAGASLEKLGGVELYTLNKVPACGAVLK
jgi:CRISPR-associated protein Csd2